jgi:hypothetical protein
MKINKANQEGEGQLSSFSFVLLTQRGATEQHQIKGGKQND